MDLHLTQSHLWALVIGFGLGLLLFLASARSHWKTGREFRRYKKMLSDKMELEQRQLGDITKERERLLKDNENLRLQVARLNDRTDNKVQRELEIYARAEKQMNISAPGFAPAWEIAKSQALSQLETEERGNSFPQRIFRKLVGNGAQAALPAEAAANAKNGSHTEVHSA
jgi:DNA repair exonuclease SbcCD ATPase subunit